MTGLRVGIFGAGVVGGGVYELLQKHTTSGKLVQLSANIEIVKICVRDLNKSRDFMINTTTTQVTTNYDDILLDDSINCVVELMGGVTDAKHVVFEAIQRGKHVVTANKALIASYLTELQALLQQHPEVV